jgi:dienelactone hydrolase
MGCEIELTTAEGERFRVYLAGGTTTQGAVLILHEWGGEPHNRQWADMLAEASMGVAATSQIVSEKERQQGQDQGYHHRDR